MVFQRLNFDPQNLFPTHRERQANPNLADSDGWTALTYASRCGSPEAVQALLETLGETPPGVTHRGGPPKWGVYPGKIGGFSEKDGVNHDFSVQMDGSKKG